MKKPKSEPKAKTLEIFEQNSIFNFKTLLFGHELNSRKIQVEIPLCIWPLTLTHPKYLYWQPQSKRIDQEQTDHSDQDLYCMPIYLHLLNTLLYILILW